MTEEEQAKNALLELARRKMKDSGIENRAKEHAVNSMRKLGVSKDMLGYGAGAAKIVDMLDKQEMEFGVDLSDDLKLNTEIGPREKALKLLYNKKF